ncbi:MAG: glucose-6-phosphate isomerase [Rhodocyclaceae bacterium]|nr:glucose-6-phosphate isomerase [Rhodocyclaceae bacterium]
MIDLPRPAPESLPAWQHLLAHARGLSTRPIIGLFREDPLRAGTFALEWDGLYLDYSKQLVDAPARQALADLARETLLAEGIKALFSGALVNHTEGRAVLHMALRDPALAPPGDRPEVDQTRARMTALAEDFRAGRLMGAAGHPLDTVVNLGIGGSDLGPRMAVEALAAGPGKVHFVANIDARDFQETVAGLDPARTLFIISSKSFGTAETLSNARAARQWLGQLGVPEEALDTHFVAVSNAVAAARHFGIAPERILPLPEWVGGRFSVWSAIGLPLLLAIGPTAFDQFLAGGRAMDQHFRSAPILENLPVLMGLVGLWNTVFLGAETLAVLPYAHGLRSFPAYLQQLEMESNGKRVRADGSPVAGHTAPIVWGGAGTIGQHAFHQLFYQGTRRVPLDFIVPAGGAGPAQQGLVDNALAQAAALMQGRDAATAAALLAARGLPATEVARLTPHLVCPGNQPSTTLLFDALTPYRLGQLVALYEHKVFVQGWLWGINSFDQYGVELGKEMARNLASGQGGEADPSTAILARRVAALQGRT